MNTRRKLVIAVGANAFAPLTLFAQVPGKVWRIGFLVPRHVDFVDSDYIHGPFLQGMRELGYLQGKNLLIEWRSSEGDANRLPELAVELVRLKVDLIATAGTQAAFAAQRATNTIPIVMISIGDPVGSGLVKSMARPGGNSTGLSNMIADLSAKLLEKIHEMLPKVSSIGVLVTPANPTIAGLLKAVESAAPHFGIKIHALEASTPQEITNGFAAMVRQKTGALIVPQDPFLVQQKNQILELAAKQKLPTIAGYREFVEAGGLISYGQNAGENFRRAATYVDKIFKGAKAGELPVEQPTAFELIVNMKTAKTLGIKVPQTILIQATKVIE